MYNIYITLIIIDYSSLMPLFRQMTEGSERGTAWFFFWTLLHVVAMKWPSKSSGPDLIKSAKPTVPPCNLSGV